MLSAVRTYSASGCRGVAAADARCPDPTGRHRTDYLPVGHDLAIVGVQAGSRQDYGAPECLAQACHGLPDRGGRWALIDPAVARQVHQDAVDETRLQLAVTPPPVRALVVRGVAQVVPGSVSLVADRITPLDLHALGAASRDFR